jgi:chromosomal replication initiation ATPase DnaA
MADAQRQFAKHYKEVRARLERTTPTPPVSKVVLPVVKTNNFETRTDEVKAWVQKELARWETVPRVSETIPINVLIEQVATKYGISSPLMLQDSRMKNLVHARQEMFYRCVMEKGWSYARIGRYFDRDHTTVLHGVRAHARKHNLPLPDGVKR